MFDCLSAYCTFCKGNMLLKHIFLTLPKLSQTLCISKENHGYFHLSVSRIILYHTSRSFSVVQFILISLPSVLYRLVSLNHVPVLFNNL